MAVLYLGQLAEIAASDRMYETPRHPYTRALLDSVPGLDPETGVATRPITLPGDVPSPIDPPSGCRFRTRCPLAQDICARVEPALEPCGGGGFVACHFPLDDDGRPTNGHPEAASVAASATASAST